MVWKSLFYWCFTQCLSEQRDSFQVLEGYERDRWHGGEDGVRELRSRETLWFASEDQRTQRPTVSLRSSPQAWGGRRRHGDAHGHVYDHHRVPARARGARDPIDGWLLDHPLAKLHELSSWRVHFGMNVDIWYITFWYEYIYIHMLKLYIYYRSLILLIWSSWGFYYHVN